MALRAIKSPSRFARHTGQSPTRNVYHISVRMLPGRGPGHMAPPVPAGRAHHVRPCPDPLLCLGRLLALLRGCCVRCLGLLRCAQARFQGSPCFPPRPCRPAGAPGEREASGLSAAFRGPLAAAPRAVGGPRCAISGAVHNPEIVNRVLTFRCGRAILVLRGPFRSFLGLLFEYPWTARSPSPGD